MRGTRRGLEIEALGTSAALAQPSRPAHPRRSADGQHPVGASGRRVGADAAPRIRVAARLARFDGLRRPLDTAFQVLVRMIPAPNYAGVTQARQIELAGLGPSLHAAAWFVTNGSVAPILTAEQIDEATSYVAIMVTRAEAAARRRRS